MFGSMLPAQGAGAKPLIRFVHQMNLTAPMYVLHEMKVDTGGRFYAILQRPAQLERVDLFETEVNWGPGYDKINFTRVAPTDRPVGIYLGEIQMTLAERRDAPGKGLMVSARDDFETAAKDFRRRYPRFDGTLVKGPMMRNPIPLSDAPKRITLPK